MGLRLLLDENVPLGAVPALAALGHDIEHVGLTARGLSDPGVLTRADAEGRVLLTFDKDFGDLVVWGRLHSVAGVVLFRLGGAPSATVVEVICQTMSLPMTWAGHFAVADGRRVRLRPLRGV